MASQTLEELLQAIEAALDEGRPDEALAAADQAERLDSESPDAAFLKAEVLLELGQAQQALNAYGRADQLLPGAGSRNTICPLSTLRNCTTG